MMKLLKFRVENFRSVNDSGWIETDTVTALIGTNESGKTNLLVPLWKLKPAKEGQINQIADFPRKRYNEIRSMERKPVFITAHFELPDELAQQIAELTSTTIDDVKIAEVQRDLGGSYYMRFPNAQVSRTIHKDEVAVILEKTQREISGSAVEKAEEALKANILLIVGENLERLNSLTDQVDSQALEVIVSSLEEVSIEDEVFRQARVKRKVIVSSLEEISIEEAPIHSAISPRFAQCVEDIKECAAKVKIPHPQENPEAKKLVWSNLPSFVYYSNYGNLDSEIYLPYVIQNLARKDLGTREEAKVRTLKVLFEFVRLKPEEIKELGLDHQESQDAITEEQIKEIAKKKTERDILLQSASTELTGKFRDWWKQGTYRFRFQADGDHFRIWVSDDKRPEDIELEGRSAGLQWFLSFYLIFLVESGDSHAGSILLLDEPGHSLHPIAQKDLSTFFESLSKTNQLIYTTHSPFLVDPDRLDRVNAVYVDDSGATKASANLRTAESDPAQSQSMYPVYAALGLSVSDTLLQGCCSVIVEGPSDQMYLSAIKTYLIGEGELNPKRDIVFIPAGGTKGVRAVTPIIIGKGEKLPWVVLDSDANGQSLARELSSGLYNADRERIISVGDIRNLEKAKIEDLFPTDFLAGVVTRYFRRLSSLDSDDEFSDVVDKSQPIVPQVEAFAAKHNLPLPKPGWKVDVSRLAKTQLLKRRDRISVDLLSIWKTLFSKFESV